MQYTNLLWRNGQPYSELFDDIYYSSNDDEAISGEAEFNHVFFNNNGLPKRWNRCRRFVIAELGLGSGLNCLLTIRAWLKHCDSCEEKKTLHYIAIEKYPLSPNAITELIARYPALQPYCEAFLENYPPAVATMHSRSLFDNKVVIHFKFMDACEALENDDMKVDAWYLDGFSPAKNADMWSQQLFFNIAKNSYQGTTCSTYTSAGQVKRNLLKAGFSVKKVVGYGKKREMLVADYKASSEQYVKFSDKPWYRQPTMLAVTEKNATIIGAGIAGLSVAYALVKRGWHVTVIDKHTDIASEASANPAAIVYPRFSINNDIDTDFFTAAYCYSLHFLRNLQLNIKHDFWFTCGVFQLFNKKSISTIIEKFQFNKDFVRLVTNTSDQNNNVPTTHKPARQDDDDIYAYYESAGVVLPEVLCAALKQACGSQLKFIKADISDVKNTISQNNTKPSHSWHCYSGDDLIEKTDVLIIANGAGINNLSVNRVAMKTVFPIEIVRGQVAVFDENIKSKSLQKTVNADVYVTPSIQGKHYVGATYSKDRMNCVVDKIDNDKLFDLLDNVYPDMFKQEDYVNAWVGFRTMSEDRVAIVGAMPDQYFFNEEYADLCHGKQNKTYLPARYERGLYLSVAHGSRGFTSSFLSAEIIAAQIAGEPMPVSDKVLHYLSPSRFIVKKLRQRRKS